MRRTIIRTMTLSVLLFVVASLMQVARAGDDDPWMGRCTITGGSWNYCADAWFFKNCYGTSCTETGCSCNQDPE